MNTKSIEINKTQRLLDTIRVYQRENFELQCYVRAYQERSFWDWLFRRKVDISPYLNGEKSL